VARRETQRMKARKKTMDQHELQALFDRQAAGYDQQWARTAPIRDGLHFLLTPVFAALPSDARILCVGVGTGAELAHLAAQFPGFSFTAVDPSGAMIEACRRRAEQEGFAARCQFHAGYLDTLPTGEAFDGATCFLVSQFMLDRTARAAFFQGIAVRLKAGGILASSDLASAAGAAGHDALLQVWLTLMAAAAGLPPDAVERMRAAYAKDVAILPATEVAAILEAGGFVAPVQFFQAGMIHAWFSRRAGA